MFLIDKESERKRKIIFMIKIKIKGNQGNKRDRTIGHGHDLFGHGALWEGNAPFGLDVIREAVAPVIVNHSSLHDIRLKRIHKRHNMDYHIKRNKKISTKHWLRISAAKKTATEWSSKKITFLISYLFIYLFIYLLYNRVITSYKMDFISENEKEP